MKLFSKLHNSSKKLITFFKNKRKNYLFLILATLFFQACSPTRYLENGEYLLAKNEIKVENKELDKGEIRSYIKQKTNKKILGVRVYARIYNTVDPVKEEKREEKRKKKEDRMNARRRAKGKSPREKFFITRWIRKIGEKPVVWDKYKSSKTVSQLNIYLKNSGYYQAQVSYDTTLTGKKKVNVIYQIESGPLYIMRNINDSIPDPDIKRLIDKEQEKEKILKSGEPFNVDILQKERTRLTKMLQNNGYYSFTKEYIYFLADSALNDTTIKDENKKKIDVTLGVKNVKSVIDDHNVKISYHKKYFIDKILIYTDFDPKKALDKENRYFSTADTQSIGEFYFMYHNELQLNPSTIMQGIFITGGSLYRKKNVKETYDYLNTLRIFRLVNIHFQKSERKTDSVKTGYLNCVIQLTPATTQSYQAELEGTTSSGNTGVAGNLVYRHKSLFKGAELFDFRFRGALEAQGDVFGDSKSSFNTVEYGVESRLTIPKFIAPLKYDKFKKGFIPKTTMAAGYNYQKRPDYTRTIVNFAFGYDWKRNQDITWYFNPIEFNAVKIPEMSAEFDSTISRLYIAESYRDHLISSTNLSFIFNNQNINKTTDFVYFKFFAEAAGNILAGTSWLFGRDKEEGSYEILNTRFSQYLKTDVDFRYYDLLKDDNQIVYRIFAGLGYPYGNVEAMPFSKKYYAGGANSLRAWTVRSLGPGSYHDPDQQFPNQTADIILESNLEYRFAMFWMLEGALFLDAGNIWAIRQNDDRPGALFQIDQFLKEIAIGTGFGVRLDFSFFVFRVDIGLKLRDPKLPSGDRWIPFNRKFGQEDWNINLGIGYPF